MDKIYNPTGFNRQRKKRNVNLSRLVDDWLTKAAAIEGKTKPELVNEILKEELKERFAFEYTQPLLNYDPNKKW